MSNKIKKKIQLLTLVFTCNAIEVFVSQNMANFKASLNKIWSLKDCLKLALCSTSLILNICLIWCFFLVYRLWENYNKVKKGCIVIKISKILCKVTSRPITTYLFHGLDMSIQSQSLLLSLWLYFIHNLLLS